MVAGEWSKKTVLFSPDLAFSKVAWSFPWVTPMSWMVWYPAEVPTLASYPPR